MVSMLASSVVDCGSKSYQTKTVKLVSVVVSVS